MTPSKLRYRGAVYRLADLLGRRAVDPYVPGGPAQPYLYHVTDAASLPQIRQQGLRPGTGTKWDVLDTQQHSQGRVFFSTQPDKWLSSINSPDRILLRVPTGAVSCLYDGGEWLYSGDEPEDEIIDGRLADCYGTDVVPPHLIEYAQDVPNVITDTSTLAWKPLVPRKPNHIGAVVQYRGAVYRLVTAAKTVMYHGTSAGPDGKLLTRILKEGLNPTPKKKIYDSPEGDYDLEWETELSISLDESFGGVYLTNKLGRAKTYADHAANQRGGDRILVAVQVETRSPGTAVDEDLVFRNAFDFVDRWLDTDTWYEADVLIESGEVDWHGLAKDYLTDHLNLKLHPNRVDTVVLPLAEALKGIYRFHLYRDHEREIEQGYEEAGDEYFEFDPGVVEDALSDYQVNGNIVTQKLREMVEPKTKDLHNIRFTTPISYRGANRIIAVVSSDVEGEIQTIHYAADKQVANQLASALKAKRSYATP